VRRAYRALDHTFTVDAPADCPPLAAAVGRLEIPVEPAAFGVSGADSPPAYEISGTGERSVLLRHGTPVGGLGTPEEVAHRLLIEISLVAATTTVGALSLHAGAVVTPGGRTVVVSGSSGSGKTTLTARLVDAGLAFLADEVCAVDAASLLARPFPRALSIKEGSPLYPRDARGWAVAMDIGSVARKVRLAEPAPVAVVVFPRHTPGAAPTLEPVHRADAMLRLAENSSALPRTGLRGVHVLETVVRGADCVALHYDDARAAVRQLQDSGLLR
jgi:hypothetical protein